MNVFFRKSMRKHDLVPSGYTFPVTLTCNLILFMRAFFGYLITSLFILGFISCSEVFRVDYPTKISGYLYDRNGTWSLSDWHTLETFNESGEPGGDFVLADSAVDAELHFTFQEVLLSEDSDERMGIVVSGMNEPDTFVWHLSGDQNDRKPFLNLAFPDSNNFTGVLRIEARIETWDRDVIDFNFRTGTGEMKGWNRLNRMKIRKE